MKAAPLYGKGLPENMVKLPNTGAIIDTAALDSQILLPNDPNFGVDSQMFIDPASLRGSGFLDSVSVIEDETAIT
jgi:hypothetical protein